MSYQLFVCPEVHADIEEAEVWYEQQEPGLGKEFTRTVTVAMRELARQPLIYRLRHRRLGIRWCYPPRFPYRIVYRLDGNAIVVLALLHAKQHDRHWRKRARES